MLGMLFNCRTELPTVKNGELETVCRLRALSYISRVSSLSSRYFIYCAFTPPCPPAVPGSLPEGYANRGEIIKTNKPPASGPNPCADYIANNMRQPPPCGRSGLGLYLLPAGFLYFLNFLLKTHMPLITRKTQMWIEKLRGVSTFDTLTYFILI